MGECVMLRRAGGSSLNQSTLAFHVRRSISQGGTFAFTAQPGKDYLVAAMGGDGAFTMIIHGTALQFAYGWISNKPYNPVDVSDHFAVSGNTITISGSGLYNGTAYIHTNDSSLT